MRIALIGSVSSSRFALEGLIRGGVDVACVLGVDESLAEKISDYQSLAPLAREAGIPFLAFTKVTEQAVEAFIGCHKPDQIWVIGLSQMVGKKLLDLAPNGGVGFHPTMLPKGRGRAPVAWTILLNERAAVNLFYLCDEPDAGDIIIQREVPVLPDDYSEDLIERTNETLRDVVVELVPQIKSGHLPRTPQDHHQATYYEKRSPTDGVIDWHQTTDDIYRLIRAVGRPYPGAYTTLGDATIAVWRGKPEVVGQADLAQARRSVLTDETQPANQSSKRGLAADATAEPGTIMAYDPDVGVLVRTKDGGIWLTDMSTDERPVTQVNFFRLGAVLGRCAGSEGQNA